MNKNPMTLWIFDIDGTLVNINHVHLKAYKHNYKQHLKRNVPDNLILSTFGMTESDMHKTIFKALKLPWNQTLADAIISDQPTYFIQALGREKVVPLEGVVDFLNVLKSKNEPRCIVTGNLEEPAQLILKKSGLSHYFSFIECDDGKSTRIDLVKRAIGKAKKQFNFDKVIIIGDTTQDIKAGKAVGAFTVAVATGSDSIDVLRSADPDIVLRNMKEYQKLY
jgi:HAD superfamily hydrolase (TIGR01549 family)